VVKPTGTETGGGGWPAAAAWARPLSQYDRAAEAPVPVSQYRLMLSEDVVAGEVARGLAVDRKAPGDLVVAVGVVVQHPGGQGDRGVQQGIADRLGPGGLLQEVAEAGRPEGLACSSGRAFLLGVRRHGPPPRAVTSRLVWMPTSPWGVWRPMASVMLAPTSPPWAT
jgi:hypothetical protein